MATRAIEGPGGWKLVRSTTVPSARRRTAEATVPARNGPERFLDPESIRVEEVVDALPREGAARRGLAPELGLEVDTAPGEASLLAIRHPSGALTFHRSTEVVRGPVRRGARRGEPPAVTRFRVPVRRTPSQGARRGFVTDALKVFVLKVAKKAIDRVVGIAVETLVARFERTVWKRKLKLEEGWFRVQPVVGNKPTLRLTPGKPKPGAPSLLLVHGTFSNAASAFGGLAGTDFFERVKPLYGDRVFAFNHYSLSRTPTENAKMLLEQLPAGNCELDAITHSRGGLVLRSLVEHRAKHGTLADRAHIRHAVLVASPNDGTPLATPNRWEETLGWLANLLEKFPVNNPFTTGGAFISEALVWLASHLALDVPGLRSMDGAGELVADLQAPPGPPAGVYSALVSNFHPTGDLLQRAIDVGIDEFFASANDLVVPTEGGWRIDRDGTAFVPGNSIGCYGPGGNLGTADDAPVHHINFFARATTAEFLAKSLAGETSSLQPIDPATPLPDRRFRRSAEPGVPMAARRMTLPAPIATPASSAPTAHALLEDTDTFHIVVMNALTEPSPAGVVAPQGKFVRVLASYGGARVMSWMRVHSDKGEERTKFGKIISTHEAIKDYTNGVLGSTLPDDDAMVEFGSMLFDTLFQDDVRRLYDEARARERGRKLDLVLTSMIPWIAEKPWEFAYDSSRKSFLATEEIDFVRNVLTAIPAERIVPCDGPLRILVAAAQPVASVPLSTDQEIEVIRRGFEPLIDAGLAKVEVLPRATPAAIHGHLSSGQYGIVHFIGHGVFDAAKGEGCLIFEDGNGGQLPLYQRSVREIFCRRGVNLVFLNACQSGTGGRADFNKGVAQSLVAHGLPALVANQYSVLDASATSFAQHFYWSLAQGSTLGTAAREARIAVNYSLNGEIIDWAVPVMYARDPNRALCPSPARRTAVPATMVKRSTRRALQTRPVRVGVWDTDDVFPGLRRTLDVMNGAQSIFGFEIVAMSTPIDAWDRESSRKRTYLWAEHFADRLKGKPLELDVDLLACVTRNWLRDDEWLNLYGWWPNGGTPAVAIFSCAGLEGLEAEGPDTDRAIANAMVSALAGFFADMGTHSRKPADCPLAFNQGRKLEHVVGTQHFDGTCRRILRRKLGAPKLAALDKLLVAFAPRPSDASRPRARAAGRKRT